jgi:TPR repeat protein
MKFSITFLTLFLFSISQNLNAQDLTGTWEGELDTRSNVKYEITLYLSKTADNIYSGVSQTKMKRTGKANDLLSGGRISLKGLGKAIEKNPSSSSRVFATNTNKQLKLSKLSVIDAPDEKMGWEFGEQAIILQQDSDDRLTASGTYNFTLKKKSNNYPSEYSKYAIEKFVTINSIKFKNSGGNDKIIYNDKGAITFSFTNNTDIDLRQLQLKFFSPEKETGIIGLEQSINSNISLSQGQTLEGIIDIYSTFGLRATPINFIVEGSYNGAAIFKKDFTLSTEPFYKTDKTVLNNSSKAVYNVLAGYYGFNKTHAASIVNQLNQYAASGNSFAPMYKAIFHMTGWGGMAIDDMQANQLVKKCSNAITEAARKGDAEAQYLMFYLSSMDQSGVAAREIAGDFLKRSAEAGFLLAMYDYGLFLQKGQQFSEALSWYEKCYQQGLQKASLMIGYIYRKGLAGDKNLEKAVQWFLKSDAFGDPAALMQLAYVYTDGEDIEPDAPKAIMYANKAVANKNTDAMNFLGKIYLTGKNGVSKNETKALELFKQAAALNDKTAMTTLAYLFLEGRSDIFPKDEKTAFFWAKKSAESGGGESMALLAKLYEEGKVTDKNIIKSRFWANQAYLNGAAKKDNRAENIQAAEMNSIVSGIDFSDQYSLWTTSSGETYAVNEGSDPIGSLISSTFSTVLSRRSSQQQVINGLELIYTRNGKKIYGGTLTSKLTTDIMMKSGSEVLIKAYGTVNLGTFAGVAGPGGIFGFQSYSIVQSIPHAAIMSGVNNEWVLTGAETKYKATADGKLQLAINDTDYSNNVGYFDVVIELQ